MVRLILVAAFAALLSVPVGAADDPWGYALDRGVAGVVDGPALERPEAYQTDRTFGDRPEDTSRRAPTNPGVPGAPGVPLDGGLGLLALAGAGYAARKLRRRGALSLVLALGTAGSASAQAPAVLSPGDVVVTSYYTSNGGGQGGDDVGLVTTVHVPRGTTFRISDGGWNGTTIRTDSDGGNLATYVAPCDLPAGTAFEYNFTGTDNVSSYTCPAGGPAAGTSAATGFTSQVVDNSVSGSGDQVLIYQDAANSQTTSGTGAGTDFQRFVYAVSTRPFVATGTAPTDNTSQLPPLLDLGSTALELPLGNSVYNGTGTGTQANRVSVTPNVALRTGSRGQILLNVGDVTTNWTGNSINTRDNGSLAQAQVLSFTVNGNATLGTATAVGGAGWRNLSVPGSGTTVASLVNYTPPGSASATGINLIQGLQDELPIGTNGARLIPILYTGYNGDNADDMLRPGGFRENNLGFVPPNNEAVAITPGKGVLWYFFDVAAGPFTGTDGGVGTTTSKALPVLLPTLGTEITSNVAVSFTEAERTSARAGVGVTPNGAYFLGNPFRQAFDLTGLTQTRAGVSMQAAFSFWNPNAGGPQVPAGNGTAGSYVIRNAIAGDTPTANVMGDDIQVWQGFYAEVTGATAATLPTFSFSAASRVSTARPTFYGRSAEPLAGTLGDATAVDAPESAERLGGDLGSALVQLQLVGETAAGGTYDAAAQFYFNAEGGLDWDPFDLTKLGSLGFPSATLAPVGPGPDGEARALSQRSLPATLDAALATPVQLDVTGAAGTFTMSWSLADVPDEWSLTLVDLDTGQTVDMRASATYTFDADEGTADRFSVTVSPRTVSTEAPTAAPALALSAPRPNPASVQATFALTSTPGERVRVVVYDALGRQVAILADDVSDGTVRTLGLDTGRFAPGVYTIRAVSGDRVATQRLAVVR